MVKLDNLRRPLGNHKKKRGRKREGRKEGGKERKEKERNGKERGETRVA